MNRYSFWLIWIVGLGPVALAVIMYFSGWLIPDNRSYSGELLAQSSVDQWNMDKQLIDHTKPQWKLVLTAAEDCGLDCEVWMQKLEKIQIALGKDRERVLIKRVANPKVLPSYRDSKASALWIADPLGNLVFRYELAIEPKLLLKDLRRLLKVSRIG